MGSLAQATEPYLLKRTLRLALSPLVRSQDAVRLIALVANNAAGTDIAWDFFRENYQDLYDRYGGGHFLIESLIKSVSSHFSSEFKLKDVQAFFKEHYLASGSRAIEQSVETIEYRIGWLQKNLHRVETWLQEQQTNNWQPPPLQ